MVEHALDTKHLPDLSQAGVSERELNPLIFDTNDYTDVHEFIKGMELSEDNEVLEFNAQDNLVEQLSVNGSVVIEPVEAYLANPAISSSDCKQALKTPLHYFHNKYSVLPKKSADHFELGTFCHMAFLEPSLFDTVVVEPKASLASNDGVDTLINFWQQFVDEEKQLMCKKVVIDNGGDLSKLPTKKQYYGLLIVASGKTAIQEEHKLIIDIIKSNYYRYGNGIIPKLMRGSVNELSMYGTDPSTGLQVKIRPDAMNFEENIGTNTIISFKTTHADNIGKFMYDSAQYKYELSEGMYLEVASLITGRKFTAVITVMLQTVAPYLPAVLYWDADNLASGKYKYAQSLQLISECEDSKIFPGFDAMSEIGLYGIIEAKQPDWAMREILPTSIEN